MRLKKLTSEGELYAFTNLFVKACQAFQHITVHRLAYEYFEQLIKLDNYEIWLLYDDEGVLVGFMDLVDTTSPVMPFRRTRCQFIYVEPHVSAKRLMLRLREFAFQHEADIVEITCKIGQEAQWEKHGFTKTSLTLKGPQTWATLLQS